MKNPYKDYYYRNSDGKVTHCYYCVATPPSRPQDSVVIFRESSSNGGASLDKVRGEIAQQVAQDLNTSVERLNWYEQKPDKSVEKHTFQRQSGYSKADNDIALTGKTDVNDARLARKVERVVSTVVKMTIQEARKFIGWTLAPTDPLDPAKVKRRSIDDERLKQKPRVKPMPKIKPKP